MKPTEFHEITQYNDHYAVQGHSRSPILVPIESPYDFLLVINSNLPSILHRLQQKITSYGWLYATFSLEVGGALHFNALTGGDPLRISS